MSFYKKHGSEGSLAKTSLGRFDQCATKRQKDQKDRNHALDPDELFAKLKVL